MFQTYKTLVDRSFENAEKGISKITDEIIKMEGMSGTKTRHLYNNLLDTNDARYLEIGTWKGSTVCAAMCNNKAKVVCVDNWSEFEGPKDEFIANFNKFKGDNYAIFIENNCFNIDVSTLPKFNIYMYDGNHENISHYRALTHFYDCLDDIFIYIVDDWNMDYIRTPTKIAIHDLNLKVLYEKEFFTSGNGIPDTWWNGIYVAILQK
jgi:Methyltransferase domain